MGGLYHDFRVIEKCTHSLSDPYSYEGNLMIHDDFILYIHDSLLWIDTINASIKMPKYKREIARLSLLWI